MARKPITKTIEAERTNVEALVERTDVGEVRYPTPLQLKVLEEIIGAGNHFVTACRAAGVSWDAFQEWRDRGSRGDPNLCGFVEMMDRAEAKCEQLALAIIMECAKKEKTFTKRTYDIRLGKGENAVVKPAEEMTEHDNDDRWKAAAWVLENRFSTRFSRMRQLQHSGMLTNRQVIILDGENDDSLELTEWEEKTPHELPEAAQDLETGADGNERDQ